MPTSSPIPVTLLSGFLGSGKTTLLNELVKQPEMSRALVIINEFGEIGLDHKLFVATEESLQVELSNGCMCCTLRGDLVTTLSEALWRFSREGKRLFDHVIIETSGLADPAPILHTLNNEPRLARRYKLDAIVTVVDGINADATLRTQTTAVHQVSMADLLVISKSELCHQEALDMLEHQLASLNPLAERLKVNHGHIEARHLLKLRAPRNGDSHSQTLRWLAPIQQAPSSSSHTSLLKTQSSTDTSHLEGIESFSLHYTKPLPAARLNMWLTMMNSLMGEQMLRFKGIVDLEGYERPTVIHGVQHIIHPPVELAQWPDDERGSTIVFIIQDISRESIEQSLEEFLGIYS